MFEILSFTSLSPCKIPFHKNISLKGMTVQYILILTTHVIKVKLFQMFAFWVVFSSKFAFTSPFVNGNILVTNKGVRKANLARLPTIPNSAGTFFLNFFVSK
jgi:hypothetical protein